MRRALCLLAAYGALLVWPAAAEPYRLTVGDRISVAVFGEAERWEGTVDLDGRVRLPGFGSHALSQLTLDEAEERLGAAMRAREFFADPQISIAIEAYAPVVVGGDVRSPGVFPFSPGLTVGTAAGLAGGLSGAAIDAEDRALARIGTRGQLLEAEQELLSRAVELARLRAQLGDRPSFDTIDLRLPPGLEALRGSGFHDSLVAAQMGLMAAEDAASRARLNRLDDTREEIARQIETLENRLAVQQEVVTLQQEELAAARQLNERGLRTRGAMARFESLEAAAREDVLEVETLLVLARIRRLENAEALTRHKLDRRAEIQTRIAAVSAQHQALITRRGALIERLLLLDQGAAAEILGEDALEIRYQVSRAGGGAATVTRDETAPLRPGDQVTVEVIVPNGLLTRVRARSPGQ
ncbi:MAG: polysaccharide biosynthesis/export family protein [Pseudomonadota bacterium]